MKIDTNFWKLENETKNHKINKQFLFMLIIFIGNIIIGIAIESYAIIIVNTLPTILLIIQQISYTRHLNEEYQNKKNN